LKSNDNSNQSSDTLILVARVLALIFVIAVSVYIITIPEEQADRLEGYGYPGIFILSILSNATVLIPAPGLIIVFSMGARINPFWVGIAAGLGATIGELSGYLAGFSGQAIIENRQLYERMVTWMKKNGPLTVVSLAFIPNPIFDLTGIAAGALKMPIWKFLFWAMIGKIIKMLLTAYAGAGLFSIPWLNEMLSP
jgi:membrane protein DedA with SNARE-associated domain